LDVHGPDVCQQIAEVMYPFIEKDRKAGYDNTSIFKYYISKKYRHLHEEVFFTVIGMGEIPWSIWKSWKFKLNKNVFHFILDLEPHRQSKRLNKYKRKSAKVFKHIFNMIGISHRKDLKEMLSHSDTKGISIAHLAFNHSPDIARVFLDQEIRLDFIDAAFGESRFHHII